MSTHPSDHAKVVILRANAIKILENQLIDPKGNPRYADPGDRQVVLMSTLVDPAPNPARARETAEACLLILKYTHWQIRILTKFTFLEEVLRLIPEEYHGRLILGFSTGTLDDGIAGAIEEGTAKVSKRIGQLHRLQDRGLRTFGMLCPSLPQDDYDAFSRKICDAIRVDRCEHIWAEVINPRGSSLNTCVAKLRAKGYCHEANLLARVTGPLSSERWDAYARSTFEAHAKNIPAEKFTFLQYVR